MDVPKALHNIAWQRQRQELGGAAELEWPATLGG
jgi:hypothetical protein